MKSYKSSILAAALLTTGLNALGQTPARSVDSYLSTAKAAAGTDWTGTFARLCIPPPPAPARGGAGQAAAAPPGGRGAPARDTWYAEPMRVADNLYFLGTKGYTSWAIVGSEGIILIEAIFDYAVKDEIIDGMKKLGLDPNKIKYVVLSHAHGDHDGGAKYLQDNIKGVRLVYGLEDWDLVEQQGASRMGGQAKKDMVGDDGMVITVGDASVKVLTMPGHTAGTLSYLFEVRDNGKPMRVAYVGGTAIPFNGTGEYYDRYIASSQKVAKAAAAYGATTLLSNHTEFDNAYFKAHVAAARKGGEANPFDLGATGVANYFKVVEDCATAARIRATGK
ncbi:MAG: MBL fold metallo-hydrolase [Bryobacteraceae bacterium]